MRSRRAPVLSRAGERSGRGDGGVVGRMGSAEGGGRLGVEGGGREGDVWWTGRKSRMMGEGWVYAVGLGS